MRPRLLPLCILTTVLTHAPAVEVVIADRVLSLPEPWVAGEGTVMAQRLRPDGTIDAQILGSRLAGGMIDESVEMLTLTPEKRRFMRIIDYGTIGEGRYVTAGLAASDGAMVAPLILMSTYFPLDAGSVTIKLKCSGADEATLQIYVAEFTTALGTP